MEWSLLFFFNSIMLGVGLAMDALAVGFTIAEYNFVMALTCALITGVF